MVIGGEKQKVTGAVRNGVHAMVMPKANEQYLREEVNVEDITIPIYFIERFE